MDIPGFLPAPTAFLAPPYIFRNNDRIHRRFTRHCGKPHLLPRRTRYLRNSPPATRKSKTKLTATATKPQQAQSAEQHFDWVHQWYPIALVTDLKPDRPNALTLQSTALVAFRSGPIWTVLHDRCPHRYAALSHGQVVGSHLECRYHGWQFAADGQVARIPQAAPQSCATATPARAIRARVEAGILFASLGDPQNPPPIVEWRRASFIVSAYSRVLPLCFSTVMQNLVDPSHIHFAHDGQIGHRADAAPVPIRMLIPASSTGFVADYYGGTVRVRFRPPCLIEIVSSTGVSFAYYTTPLAPGMCNAFAIRTTAYRQLIVPPRWADHLRRHALLEGDLALMQSQQRFMASPDGYHRAWRDFSMPAQADRLVLELRRWLDRFAPPHEWYACEPASDVGRLAHTHHCTDCRRAWQTFSRLSRFALALALVALLAASAYRSLGCAVAAGILAGIAELAKFMRRKFE